MNFMSLPDEYAGKESKYAILPVAFEGDVTYGKGASKGPIQIIKASKHLEYYDEQYKSEPFENGIELLKEITAKSNKEIVKNIQEAYPNRFTITLGGDHTTTIGAVKGAQKYNKDFSVLIFDAHSDLRDSWNNSQVNHACVAKQVSKNHNVTIVGVRSQDKDEVDTKPDDVNIIYAHELLKTPIKTILKTLKEKVYISIDVDFFDPSFIRYTGTPEPGGFFWNDLIPILEQVAKNHNIIGADIVEFAPQGEESNYRSEAYSLAKLCYKILALKEKYNE